MMKIIFGQASPEFTFTVDEDCSSTEGVQQADRGAKFFLTQSK